jgi:phage shock protein PspC (stress-responsive transcriptional regulator)
MVGRQAGSHPGITMSEHITETTEIRRLERSKSSRMVAGVAGGLARYFEIHPAVFRVGFVVLTLLGGAGLVIYAAAWLVMPDEGKEDSVATKAFRNRRDRPWPLIALALIGVALVSLLSHATLWPEGDAWWLLLIAGGLILWITRQPSEPTADAKELAREDSRRLRRVLRRIVVAFAVLLTLVIAAIAIFIAVFDVHVGRGIGDRNYVVTDVRALDPEYRLGIGTLDLDLRDLRLPAGETHVEASVDVGDLRIVVPDDVAVRAHGDVQAGEVEILGNTDDGRNVDADVSETGERVLVIDADVGAGSLRIERAVR